MKTAAEIRTAIADINANNTLTYSYREDVTAALLWVLTGEPFDGLPDYPTELKPTPNEKETHLPHHR